MLDHHIQKRLLYSLVKTESARFSEIRPKNLDSNSVTYHLKQLIKQGLVQKDTDGRYSLTAKGKIVGTTITLSKEEALHEAHSVLLMAVRNQSGEWLLRRRLAQPMYSWSGFVHGEPIAGQNVPETANTILREKTGLQAKFTSRASGYITLLDGDTHQSFIHFTLLEATDFSGKLLEKVGNGENYWYSGDFTDHKILPSMRPLIEALLSDQSHSYLELTY